MEFITVTEENIAKEHICCAISDKKSSEGYALKKEWLKERLEKGYVFRKLDARAKVFIEYAPSEVAFMPISAPNYMVINCFWVSGKYKGKGYAKAMLEACLEDAKEKGKSGVAVLCSDKKRPFLSDKKFFMTHGFEVCDTAPPYFELLVYRFNAEAKLPVLSESTKSGEIVDSSGFLAVYSHRCPYMNYYTTLQREVAEKMGIPYETRLIETQAEAENAPCPFTIYALYYKGRFVTQELTAEKKFLEIIEQVTSL